MHMVKLRKSQLVLELATDLNLSLLKVLNLVTVRAFLKTLLSLFV